MSRRQKKQKTKKERIIGGCISGILLCALFSVLIAGYIYCRPYIDKVLVLRDKARVLAAASSEESFRTAETSLVYASDGSLISVLKDEKDVYYLTADNLPEDAVKCMMVTEDRKFYTHKGYDIKANLVAAYSYIKNKGIYRGGSTITQQLARNVFLTMDVTLERKITELFLAAELEKKYTKDQIMEFYLNNIYFANGYYGIQAAAIGYFNKNASALSLAETAFVCAIPNNPTEYDPVKNYKNTLGRQKTVLDQLLECEVINTAEYKTAYTEEISLNRTQREKQDYAETYSYYCAIRALMKNQGFVFQNEFLNESDREEYEALYYESYYAVQRKLFTEGYRIYTSIDPALQEELQESLNTGLSDYSEVNEDGVYKLQGAATCIDNESGRVVAIIGGRSQEFSGYTLNRAYQSRRQAGSSIKPLIVYTPWFERGLYPDDLVLDEYFEGGPKNSGSIYSGEITVRRAIEISANTVAWKLFEELTPKIGLSYLLDMKFSGIVETDYVPAVSLGGFTYGVSALEMAAGYSTLENDGIYRDPTCIVLITDADGKIIVGDSVESHRVYETNAARMMTDILKGVMTSGTGRKLILPDVISAGKTGTTSDRKDGWFIGYTAYYTTSVWVGYDLPQRMEDLSGSTYPGQIWQDYMSKIHEGLVSVDFTAYTDDRPPEDESDTEVRYNAFGEPIDPETGLPYPTEIPENDTGTEDGKDVTETGEAEDGEETVETGEAEDGEETAETGEAEDGEETAETEEAENGEDNTGESSKEDEKAQWFDRGYEQQGGKDGTGEDTDRNASGFYQE